MKNSEKRFCKSRSSLALRKRHYLLVLESGVTKSLTQNGNKRPVVGFHGLSSCLDISARMPAGAHPLTHGRVMSAAEEYRRIAEQFIRLAREAKTDEEQRAFLEMATTWSQRAAQEDGNLWVGTCAIQR